MGKYNDCVRTSLLIWLNENVPSLSVEKEVLKTLLGKVMKKYRLMWYICRRKCPYSDFFLDFMLSWGKYNGERYERTSETMGGGGRKTQ